MIPTLNERTSGILLHITSLPGPHGCGDLGKEAYRFVDFLEASGQRWWQMLPLGPVGMGNSPYSTFSAFAGNPLLISLDSLAKEGLLRKAELRPQQALPTDHVEYAPTRAFREQALRQAHKRFKGGAAFDTFRRREQAWLADYTLFSALKERYNHYSWTTWPEQVRKRNTAVLRRIRVELADDIRYHEFLQFYFDAQWRALKAYATKKGIGLIGDVPIFVAGDSADVWAHPAIFALRENGEPKLVAGVPPDFFSKTGQRWGNPLYRWDVLRKQGYAWWIERFRKAFHVFDAVRLDHFIGFERYYEIPAEAPTAESGRYRPGPKAHFFETVFKKLGRLQFIAEDLGTVTPEVKALRARFGFPGMRVLQFAFGTDPEARNYQPHAFVPECVVYTGTHDNNTTRGWFEGLRKINPKERAFLLDYVATDEKNVVWELIRLALESVANTAIFPAQDLLDLGATACMNRPGTSSQNWEWRLSSSTPLFATTKRLRKLTDTYGRTPL